MVWQFSDLVIAVQTGLRPLKRAVLSGHFRHGGNRLLRMCFGNVVADKDAAENEKFTKERAGGALMGRSVPRWRSGASWPMKSAPSPYETLRPEGFLFV